MPLVKSVGGSTVAHSMTPNLAVSLLSSEDPRSLRAFRGNDHYVLWREES